MKRRHFLLGAAGALATSACQFTWLEEIKKTHPNVLMLIVDDLNDWIGAMKGHPNAKTPNIDRLAKAGTLFTNAHAPAPICGPSRASVMTGLMPSSTGIYGHIKDEDIKRANDKAAQSIFLSEYFREHGYYTAAIGKVFHQNIAKNSFDDNGGRVKGFGPHAKKNFKWDDPRTNTDWGAFPAQDKQMPDYDAAKWTAKKLNEHHDKPFFIACGFLRPHAPWYVPQKWFDMHPIDSVTLPPYLPNDLNDVPDIAKQITSHPMMPTTEWAIKNNEYKNIVQSYLASVSFVDSCIGIVLDALDKSVHANNTAVVLWGDHGYHIGEKEKFAKMTLWERATRTPLIIKPPRNDSSFKTNQQTSKPVSLLDLYPTLVKMCGLPENKSNQGRNLVPILKADDIEWQHAAVTTYGPNNHSVKTERYRYIRYENGAEELYDHSKDPNEWENLAKSPEYNQVKIKLITHLPKENAEWSPKSYYRGNTYFNNKTENAMVKK